MVRAFWRFGAAALLGGALLGCSARTVVQQKAPPPDPLLVTRKPVEGKARPDSTDVSARLQPPAAPASPGDVASTRQPDGPVRPAQMKVDGAH